LQSSNIIQLEIDKILIPEERVTSVLDEELLSELEASIKEKGILQPLLVALVDNKYVLIDGLHRLYIAKKLKMNSVPCIVKPMNEEELIITNLIVNRQRGRSNPADEARVIKLLIDEYKYSVKAAAEKLNVSVSTVEKYYQIAKNATDRLMDALKYGSISVGCAYYLSMIEDKNLQNQILEYAIRWSYSVDQCKAAALSATVPQYTPPPGGWAIDTSSGAPIRVKMRTALCNIDEDPAYIVNIPIPQRYADAVRLILSDAEICKTIIESSEEAIQETGKEKKEERKESFWEW